MMFRRLPLFAALALVVCFGCSFDRSNPFDPEAADGVRAAGVLVGRVLLEAGGAAQTITVRAIPTRGSGDPVEGGAASDGAFALDVPDGSYNVEISASGYTTRFFSSIALLPGERVNLGTITLAISRGLLEGVVQLSVEQSGSQQILPAQGAQVLVTRIDAEGFARIAGTDANGQFQVEGVPEGQYEVRGSLDDFAPAYTVDPIPVVGNDVTTLDPLTLYSASAVVQVVAGGIVGARYTGARDIEVQLLAFVEQLVEMRVSLDPTFSNATQGDVDWRPFAATINFRLADADGTQTVHAQFRDINETETDVYGAEIILDREAPTVPSLLVNDGEAFLTSDVAQIFVQGLDNLSGVRGYKISIDGDITDEPELSALADPGIVSLSLLQSFPGTDGPRTLLFAWVDRAGNQTDPAVERTFIKDTVIPELNTFAIGEAVSASTSVTLDIDATGVTQMRISNSSDFAGTVWQPFQPTVMWNLIPGDGDKTVYLRLRDDALNTTEVSTATTILDTTPPQSVSLSINDGALKTGSPTVILTVAASDANGPLRVMVSNDPDFAYGQTASDPPLIKNLSEVDGKEWTLLPQSGLRIVYARVFDAAGNFFDASDNIELDLNFPNKVSVALVGQPSHTNVATHTLELFAESADIVVIDGDIESAGTQRNYPPENPVSITLIPDNCSDPPNDCLRTITATYTNLTNGQSAATSTTVIFDQVAPLDHEVLITGRIADNQLDTTLTGTTRVTLDITPNVNETLAGLQMKVSNSDTLAGAFWQPFTPSIPWTLSNGDSNNKTVYVMLRDATGNEGSIISDDIELDTQPPTAPTIFLNDDDEATASPMVDVALSMDPGINSTSEIQMRLSTDGFFDTELWEGFVTSKQVSLPDTSDGQKSVWVVYRDIAGNQSLPVRDVITLDRTDPAQPTVQINGGAAATNDRSVSVSITTTSSDVVQMRVAGDGVLSANESWRDFVSPVDVTIPSGDCTVADCKVVQVELRDAALNVSTIGEDGITLDTGRPAVDSESPGDGALIGPAAAIAFTFDEPVVLASVVLGGDLAGAAGAPTINAGNTVVTVSPLAGWPDGAGQTLTIVASDPAGNASNSFTVTYDVDAEPPVLTPTPPDGFRIGASTPIEIGFSETVVQGSIVVGGSLAGLISTPYTWTTGPDTVTFNPATAWTTGPHTLSISIDDPRGNNAAVSYTYTVDAGAPSLVTEAPTDGATLHATRPIVLVFSETMDRTLTLGGTLGSAADTQVWSSTIETDDTVTLTPSGGWPDGAGKTLTVDGTDQAGNGVSPAISLTYDVDAVTPVVTDVTPVDASTIGQDDTIALTFDETMDTASLSLTGSLGTQATASWNVGSTIVTLSPTSGTWTAGDGQGLTVDAADLAGNVRSTALTYDVDGTAPSLQSADPVAGGDMQSDATVTLTFDEAINTSLFAVDDAVTDALGTVATPVWSVNDTVVELSPATAWNVGEVRVLSMSVEDTYGNATVIALTFNVDDTAPVVQSQSPADTTLIAAVTDIVVTFDEPIANDASLQVTAQTIGAPDSISASGAVVTLTPPNPDGWVEGTSLTLTFEATDEAGNLGTFTVTYDVDATAPSLSDQSPIDGASIGTMQSLVLTFDQVLDTTAGAVSFSGTMGAPSTVTPSAGNTVLTLAAPAGGWPVGDAGSLDVSVRDVPGNPATFSLSYDVLGAEVHVDDGGSASGSGSAASPLDSIDAAIQLAAGLVPPATEVRIGVGSYNVSSATGTPITLVEGVSLSGGWNNDFSAPNVAANDSRILDGNTTVDGTVGAPAAVIACGTGVTTATIVEGIEVEPADVDHAAAIACMGGASLTVQDNRLMSGDDANTYTVIADGSIVLINNLIIGGATGSAASRTLWLQGGNPILRNNVIWGETNNGSATVQVIHLSGTAQATIENNIIYTEGNDARNVLLFVEVATAGITSLRNNDLTGNNPAQYDMYSAPQGAGSACVKANTGYDCINTIGELETALAGVASGNVELGTKGELFVDDAASGGNLTLNDNDWRLKDTAPDNVRFGGLDGWARGWGFDDTKDGGTRTAAGTVGSNAGAAGWSMGAYENNVGEIP